MKNTLKKISLFVVAIITLSSCSKEGVYAQQPTQFVQAVSTSIGTGVKMAKLVPNQFLPQPGNNATFFVDYPANGIVDSYYGPSYGAPRPSHFGIFFYNVDAYGNQVGGEYLVMVPASQEPLDRLRWNPNGVFMIVGSSTVIGSSAILQYYDVQNKVSYGLNPSGQASYFVLQ